jgi:hypothetical protein
MLAATATLDEAADPNPREPYEDAAAWRAMGLPMLKELAEIGMEMARDLARRVKDAPANDDPEVARAMPADPGLSLSRIARMVHLSLSLGARLIEDSAADNVKLAELRTEARESAMWERNRHAQMRVREIDEILERAVRCAVRKARERGDPDVDAMEYHLDPPNQAVSNKDYYGDEPAPELIERLCRTYNIPFDPNLWADEPDPDDDEYDEDEDTS